jgi:hypothetical protein
MAILDHDEASADPLTQQFLDHEGHGRPGLAAAEDQDAVDPVEIEGAPTGL